MTPVAIKIKVHEDGRVDVTPMYRGAKGRPVLFTQERITAMSIEEVMEKFHLVQEARRLPLL